MLRSFCLASVLITAAQSMVLAQTFDQIENGRPELNLLLRGNDLSPEFLTFIGEQGLSARYIPETSENLGDAIMHRCGDVPEHYTLAVDAANEFMPGTLSLATDIDMKSGILLPPCPPRRVVGLATVEVPADLGPYALFFKDSAGFDFFADEQTDVELSEEFFTTMATNNTAPSTIAGQISVVDWSEAMKPVEVPYDSTYADLVEILQGSGIEDPAQDDFSRVRAPITTEHWYSIPLKTTAISSLVSAGGQVDLEALAEVAGVTPVSADIVDEFRPVAEPKQVCEPIDRSQHLRAVDNYIRVLADNAVRLARDNVASTSQIVVLDTGLRKGAEEEAFAQGTVARPVLFTERIFDTYEGMELPEADHGTRVTALALGGPDLMWHLKALGYRMTAVPVQIFDENAIFVAAANGTEAHFLHQYRVNSDRLVRELDKADRSIVNLSVGRRSPADQMEVPMEDSSALFIVAAGNDGMSLEVFNIFPANFGGPLGGHENVITVASIGRNNELANHSNFSPNFVDIAAPGCQVPTVGLREIEHEIAAIDRVVATGTSFAAPQVTSVAAILRITMPDLDAAETKLRILASADLVEALIDKVADGRVLNAAKAVAVFDDVVVMNNGDMLRGDLKGAINNFCKEFVLPESSTVLKVAPGWSLVGEDRAKALVYLRSVQGTLDRRDCDLTLQDGQSAQLFSSFDGQAVEVNLNEVVDLVFAWR